MKTKKQRDRYVVGYTTAPNRTVWGRKQFVGRSRSGWEPDCCDPMTLRDAQANVKKLMPSGKPAIFKLVRVK